VLNYLKDFMNISDPEQLYRLDETSLLPFRLWFITKKLNGRYLGCSDSMAQMLGFDKGLDVVGCTDFDLCWAKSAKSFREHDNEVQLTEKPKISIETGQLVNGKATPAISYKLPLRLRSNKIGGIICIAIPLDSDELLSGMVNDIRINTENTTSLNRFSLDSIVRKYALTKRQTECLSYLARGMTIKEIAYQLQLSPRTVEHYLDAIKIKLNCHSRSQLIAKILAT
jgi:DNA-binding CsgD family transcriptional regulator